MSGAREVVRDQRNAQSRAFWRLVEFIAGSSERGVVEEVYRDLQRRGLVPPGVRLRAGMFVKDYRDAP